MSPVVAFREVSKRFGVTAAVDGVSFDVGRGECVALLGPSGCGKTTTLRILAGFEAPDAGAVTIAGRDMRGVPPFERPIGLVFQDYALFPHMSVAENVDYGMKRRGVPKAERAGRRTEILALVRLSGLEARRPAELSGGQQQRVALARALAPRPALLLLDEPLSNLDARLRHDLRQELRVILRQADTTTLMVTHDQEEALAMADRIVLMNAGRTEQIGTPADIYARPATRFAARFLGRCNWLDGAWLDGPENPADGRMSLPHAEGSCTEGASPSPEGREKQARSVARGGVNPGPVTPPRFAPDRVRGDSALPSGEGESRPRKSLPYEERGASRQSTDARIAIGPLAFRTAASSGQGPVGLAIRPERVRLAGETPSGAANLFPARVLAARVLGADIGLDLDLGGGVRLESSLKADGRPLPMAGDAVTVEIDPDACIVLPAEPRP